MSSKFYLFSILFLLSLGSFSQVIINEGSNKNYTTIPDEDGEYEDWIELYNAGSTTIDLYNYSLTDNLATPGKWILPHLTMAPGQYEIIFCSKKDRYATQPFTNVVTSASFVPVVGWNTHTFSTPFYWDGTSSVVINICSYSSTGYVTNSVFNQSSTAYNSTTFTYNDGSPASCSAGMGNVVAQRPNIKLNGVQIGSGAIQNSPYDYPAPYGNWYWSSRNEIMITAADMIAAGFSAGNITSLAFDVAWTDPVTYDYIDISMNNEPSVEMTTAFIPSAGTNNHTNFNIDGDGETVYLMTPSMAVMSSLFVNAENYDDSYGCFPDASSTKKFFGTPTPAASNNGSTTYNGYLNEPLLSVNSGFFSTPFSVTISNPNALPSAVFYTTDGSEPTLSSTLYTGAIPITASTVLRARAFDNDSLPSAIAAASYFFGVNHITPIISVITDDANLYGGTGMFDNWPQDWLKPAHVEYFDSMPAHPLVFSQKAGIQIDGGAGGSRSNPQHSFRIEWANSVLGDQPIVHPVIPDREGRTEYNTFYLRNGSNQYLVLPYKDASQTKMMCEETNNYYSTWRPVSVYINGQYFGLYELREKYDPQMFEFQDGADISTVEMVGLSYWYGSVLHATDGGNVDNFWDSYNNFLTIDPASPTFWDEADVHFDMEYYADYIIGESWMGNVDWPQNNIKIYRSDATDYSWRFCTIDLELSLAPNNWTDCYSDNINYIMTQSPSNPYINIWLQGIQNDQFRNYFINRYADLMNTSYQPSRLQSIDNMMFNQVYMEMQFEFQKWGNPWDIPGQMTDFYNSHMIFQSELACRNQQVRDDVQNNFGLPQQVDVTLDVYPANGGKVNISTITPDTYPWNGIYFDGLPVRVEAINNFGFVFDHWEADGVIADVNNDVFNDTLFNSNVTFKAYFVEDLSVINGLENSNYTIYPSPATDFIYLVNKTGAATGQVNYQLIDMNGNLLREETINATEERQEISLDGLTDGIYFIRIISENGIENLRFVKR